MTSYVLIEFDRKAPTIQIYAPQYTTTEIVNLIIIEADETLSTYQEFYAIDSLGNRHNYTFFRDSRTTYIGRVRFNNLPHGIITFYARVKDQVDNVSRLESVTIEVKEELQLLTMATRMVVQEVKADTKPHGSQHITMKDSAADIEIREKSMNVLASDKERQIDETHEAIDIDTT